MKHVLLLAAVILVACGSDSPTTDGGPADTGSLPDALSADAVAQSDAFTATDAATEPDVPGADAAVSDAGPLTAEQACEARAARNELCGIPPESADACIEAFSCGAFFRADAIDLIVRCDTERACDEGDDRCFLASELGITESAESMEFTTTCLARRTECSNGFSEDFCYAQLASVESLGVMTGCLESDCAGDTLADCLSDAYDRTCE